MSNKIEQTSFDGSFDGTNFELEFQNEILEKTKSIIEDFTGKKIIINYNSLSEGDDYQINVPDYQNDTMIITIDSSSEDRKTSLEKAMAEILYGSDRSLVNNLAIDKTENISNVDWRMTANQSYMEGYEILNRIRCNSAIGRQSKGTTDRIIKNNSETV